MSESQSDKKNLFGDNFANWKSSSLSQMCFEARIRSTRCKPKSGNLANYPISFKISTFLRKQLPFFCFYAACQHKKMQLYQWTWKKLTVKNEGLAAFESYYCLSKKCNWRWDRNHPPHCDEQYMVSHFSVGKQTINTGVHKNNTTQWWGGWRLTTV